MSFIELENIAFSYDGKQPYIFENLSISLEVGKCLLVSGDNGCGKTTLFRILNGLSFPVKGKFFFDSVQITEKYLNDNANSKLFHKRVGYLFQNPDIMLFNGRTYDEVAFGLRQMGLSDDEVKKRTLDCMELFSITDLADKAPYHLSGGQKKRVALASVMALNPEVLVLDEPFAGLDRTTSEFLNKFLSELKSNGKTIIITAHEDAFDKGIVDEEVGM
jgi:cobalt/nickel transport system ATP-binding protein